MTNQERLSAICAQSLESRGLAANATYSGRLKLELDEIYNQNEADYFLDLHDRKVRYGENQHNLLVPFLLGIVDHVDVQKPPAYQYGEFPDIDVDYLPQIRDYLKNEWAPKQFGSRYVCNIGSYNTFGIKSALQNMARVFDRDRNEIVNLTTQLALKDDEGKALTWEKALEIYPDLKEYCEQNPDVANAARRLLNRNNSMGKHAGGLIISSVPIDEYVPLCLDKDGLPVSAWVEGLHGQDLGPMGLVKFDLLVITNLLQIALACKLIKERHGLASICALPGQKDFSDVSFLDDPKALALASKGDLKCVFQFDSDGIRRLAQEGKVDCFDDLVAYTALYRPGPLGMKMHEHYIKRKRGEESYDLHPVIRPILGPTYGIIIYQEQCMRLLNAVGRVPEKDCEIVRKAISKKKMEIFGRYKDMFLTNGQEVLGWTLEQVQDLWDQIASFAEYGFNLSHAVAYSYISAILLWLKAHYPLEFFAAVLSCEDQAEKIKEYKIEAEKLGVKVMPLDINKSGVLFQIVDDAIYFGIANVKGIGPAVAQRIVQNQPYQDFRDFLKRFGTEETVLKRLIGLRAFKDAHPVTLYKYYEWYKNIVTKRLERDKRQMKGRQEKRSEVKALLPAALAEKLPEEVFGPELWNLIRAWDGPEISPDVREMIADIEAKYNKSVAAHEKKLLEDTEVPGLDAFDPDQHEIDKNLVAIYTEPQQAEAEWYGFVWTHTLEKSPDYQGGKTFEDHRHKGGAVEFEILEAKEMESKKGNTYYRLRAQDAHGEEQWVQVWADDWARWEPELKKGNLVCMRLTGPQGGFRSYTMESWARKDRWKKMPKNKINDLRVVVLRRPDR